MYKNRSFNMGNNITSATYCKYRITVNNVHHRNTGCFNCTTVNALHEGDNELWWWWYNNNNNNLWLYINVFNRLTQQTRLLLQLSSSVTYPAYHINFRTFCAIHTAFPDLPANRFCGLEVHTKKKPTFDLEKTVPTNKTFTLLPFTKTFTLDRMK